MSENLRMFGIVAVFLLAGSLMWFMLSDSGVEVDTGGAAVAPEIERREAAVPDFEFDSVARTGSSSASVAERPRTVEQKTAEAEVVEATVEGKKVVLKRGPGKISGEVKLTTGGALPGDVVVYLHSIPDAARYDGSIDTVVASAEIGADGTYSFEKIALGSYTLFAYSAEYTGTTGTRLTKDRPESTRDLDLYGAAFVSGEVVNSSGEGISDAHVYIAGYLSGGQDLKAGMERSRGSGVGVDEAGAFTIRSLQVRVPALQYRLIATAPGYSSTVTDLLETNSSGVSIVLRDGGSVSGVVINTGTQEPVAGVDVIVGADYALATKEGMTDENGSFSLAGLSPGSHRVGIVDDILVVTSASETVEVSDGESVEDVVIEVQTGAVIAGRMYDRDTDAGIGGVEIYGAPQEIANATRKTVTTDSKGIYALEGLHAGTYRVEYGEVKGYNSQRRWEDQKNIVTVGGKETPGIDFPMMGGLRISGIVVDAQNKPVAEASVSGQTPRGNQNDYVRSEKDGRFVLSGFKANTPITLRPRATDLAGESLKVDLKEESITGIRLTMIPDAKISGVIVDGRGTPKGGAEVYVSSSENPYGSTERSGADGRFTVEGLTAGTYDIKPYRNGMSSRDKSLAQVTVAAGEHKEGVRVVWEIDEGTLEISGRVTDDLGEAVSGVRLYSWGGRGGQMNASSNAQGDYAFTGVNEGTYTIQAQRVGYQNANKSGAAGARDVNIVMARTGSVSGHVVEVGSNSVVKDFSVLVINADRPYRAHMDRDFKAYHNEEGAFSVDGAYPGSVQLMFRSPGRADVTVPVDGVVSGETREGVVVAMEAGMSLQGAVRNTSGNALGGAYIYIGPVPGDEWERERAAKATTGKDGRYTLGSLPSGDVVISAFAEGYLGESVTTQVSGSASTLDFVLGTGGTAEGYVYVDGKGKSGVNLYGSFTGGGGQQNVRGTTDESGFYQIEGLAAGTVRLNANYNENGQQRNKNGTIEIALGMVTDFNFNFALSSSSVEGYIMAGENQPSSGSANLQIDTGSGTESRYTEVGSDGHYVFENVPPGKVTVHGYSSNRQMRKRVSGELGENETLRLDVLLYGGVTIQCLIDNGADYKNLIVYAMPGDYAVPNTLTEDSFNHLNQNMIQTGRAQGSEEVSLSMIEAGEYTLVAVWYVLTEDGRALDFDKMGLTSTRVSVSGDKDVSVRMSF